MNKKLLFALWGGLFVLCAALGFIPAPAGILNALLVLLAIAFFIPPFVLIRRSREQHDRRTLKLIRNLAIASLTLTVVLIIANFLSIAASETLGSILYSMLIIVSSPMVCGRYWVLSLFLWACLLFAAAEKPKRR